MPPEYLQGAGKSHIQGLHVRDKATTRLGPRGQEPTLVVGDKLTAERSTTRPEDHHRHCAASMDFGCLPGCPMAKPTTGT